MIGGHWLLYKFQWYLEAALGFPQEVLLESSCSWRTVVVYCGWLRPTDKNQTCLKDILALLWLQQHCCWAEGTELWGWCPVRINWDIPKGFLVWRHCQCQHSLKCILHIPEVQQGQQQNNSLNISRFLLVWRNLGWFPSQGVKASINPQLL